MTLEKVRVGGTGANRQVMENRMSNQRMDG
jgi:hypothetical protein